MSPLAPPKTVSSTSILSQINEAKGQITRTQQFWALTLGIGLVTLAIGILGIQLPWQEQRQQLAARYSEEKERSDLLLGLRRQRIDLQKMEKQFLLQGEATVLQGQLSQLAAQSGLQIESVTPQSEVVAEPYTRFQIEIIATGNLTNILQFLRAVETHRPLLWVEQMDIGAPPAEGVPMMMAPEEAPADKQQNQQKVRFLVNAMTRQKISG